jgi:hypothetical protein
MMKPPTKYKSLDKFTPDDHFRELRGERVISDEYVTYKNDALHAAGLDDEMTDEPDGKPVADWTPDDHLADLQRQRP